MNRRLFILSLGAMLTAARAEIAIEPPITDTPTNRSGAGINVPVPLRDSEPANAIAKRYKDPADG
jgi:hypothetical protein